MTENEKSKYETKLKRDEQVSIDGPAVVTYLRFGRIRIVADKAIRITKQLTTKPARG